MLKGGAQWRSVLEEKPPRGEEVEVRASETALEAPFHISHRFTSADSN